MAIRWSKVQSGVRPHRPMHLDVLSYAHTMMITAMTTMAMMITDMKMIMVMMIMMSMVH